MEPHRRQDMPDMGPPAAGLPDAGLQTQLPRGRPVAHPRMRTSPDGTERARLERSAIVHDPARTAPEPVAAAVRDLYGRLLDAWNRRDADAFASLFAPDGLLVGFDGSQVAGSDVRTHLAPIFADHPTASYVAKVAGIRPLGEAAALLSARVGMVPPGRAELNPAVNAVQALVAALDDGAWKIVLYQNTPAAYHGRPDLAEEHTAAVESVRAKGMTID